jgi:hypothetical protein
MITKRRKNSLVVDGALGQSNILRQRSEGNVIWRTEGKTKPAIRGGRSLLEITNYAGSKPPYVVWFTNTRENTGM